MENDRDKLTVIQVRGCPAELHRWFRFEALRDGVSMNLLVIRAMAEYMAARQGGGER